MKRSSDTSLMLPARDVLAGRNAGPARSARAARPALPALPARAVLPARPARQVRADRDRGALNVELIGVLPLILLVILLCAQGLLIASLLPAVQQASRDGARAASMGHAVGPAVERALPSWAMVERIDVGGAARADCEGHCVRVVARVPFGVPAVTFSNVTVDRMTEMPR